MHQRFRMKKNVRERKQPPSPLGRSRSEGRKPKKLAVSTRKQRRTENRAALFAVSFFSFIPAGAIG